MADTLGQYLDGIARYPLLDKNQEILLARRVRAWIDVENPDARTSRSGQRAMEKLVNCNLRLVVHVAKRYARRAQRSEFLDLIQEGNCGLIHGVKKFDPERGYALSTYVYWWVRQAITRHLGGHDRLIRIPMNAAELVGSTKQWAMTFLAAEGRSPTLQECADHAEVPLERMRDYMNHAIDCCSLDAVIASADSEKTLIESIASDQDVAAEVEISASIDNLNEALQQLEERDRDIITQVYALNGGSPTSYIAMGKEFGCSRERIRQLHDRTLRVLRRQLVA